MFMLYISVQRFFTICGMSLFERTVSNSVPLLFYLFLNPPPVLNGYYYVTFNTSLLQKYEKHMTISTLTVKKRMT